MALIMEQQNVCKEKAKKLKAFKEKLREKCISSLTVQHYTYMQSRCSSLTNAID